MTRTKFLNSKELAEYLGVRRETLARWRKAGKGPRFTLTVGFHARYDVKDVEAWQQVQQMRRAGGQ